MMIMKCATANWHPGLANGVSNSTTGKNVCRNTANQIVLKKNRSIEMYYLPAIKKDMLKTKQPMQSHRLFLSVLIRSNLRHPRLHGFSRAGVFLST